MLLIYDGRDQAAWVQLYQNSSPMEGARMAAFVAVTLFAEGVDPVAIKIYETQPWCVIIEILVDCDVSAKAEFLASKAVDAGRAAGVLWKVKFSQVLVGA